MFQRVPAVFDLLNEMWAFPDGRKYEMEIVESTPSSGSSAVPEYVDDLLELVKRWRSQFCAKQTEEEANDSPVPGAFTL